MTTEARLEKLYTIEEFMMLPDNGKHYELVEGRLEEMSPAGRKQGKIAAKLTILLGAYILEHKLGEIYVAEAAFVLAPGTVRCPDVAFLKAANLLGLNEDGAIPIRPDLAVEVKSPTDRPGKIAKK